MNNKYLKFVIFDVFSYNSESIFRLSGVFCVDSAIFVPKYTLGPDFGPKQNFKNKT